MNYRHEFHAGNFADVLKHMVLIYCLNHLTKKDKPFYVLDTHAGKGLYDLKSKKALQTQECMGGIQALSWTKNLPMLVELYKSCIDFYMKDDLYPGSPLLIHHFLRQQDRAHGIEWHEEDYETLKHVLKKSSVTPFYQNGYDALKGFLPPPARRGLVLIDPPFEKKDEFSTLKEGIKHALKRFANGIYLIWFPIKDEKAENFYKHLLTSTKAFVIKYGTTRPTMGLSLAGLLVINPPFGLQEALMDSRSWLHACIHMEFE